MELVFNDYPYKNKKLSLKIDSSTILGITGNNTNSLINILSLKEITKGDIKCDKQKLTKDNIYSYQKQITLIQKSLIFIHSNVLNTMKDYIINHKLIVKDPIKKIKDSLKIVGLKEDILIKTNETMSSSEKKLLQIAISLLSNPEVIIIEEPFKYLDKHNEKKIVMLFQRLRDQFNKTIIIVSKDSNILYQYTNKMLFIKNDEILLYGPTSEVYLRVDYLKKNGFEIPDIVEFTYLAKKKKKVKIDYHKDVRDIIKDIYKHI